MIRNRKSIVLIIAYVLMLLAMFLLPLISTDEYSIIGNTLSDLGAQFAPNAWVMNIVFAGLALAALNAGWGYYKGYIFHRIFLALFAVSLALTAYFNQGPLNHDIEFDLLEDGLHKYFLSTAGLSFVILSVATSIRLDKQNDRILAISTGLAIIFLTVLMSQLDHFAGIWQRLQFIISFGWFIYSFKTGEL